MRKKGLLTLSLRRWRGLIKQVTPSFIFRISGGVLGFGWIILLANTLPNAEFALWVGIFELSILLGTLMTAGSGDALVRYGAPATARAQASTVLARAKRYDHMFWWFFVLGAATILVHAVVIFAAITLGYWWGLDLSIYRDPTLLPFVYGLPLLFASTIYLSKALKARLRIIRAAAVQGVLRHAMPLLMLLLGIGLAAGVRRVYGVDMPMWLLFVWYMLGLGLVVLIAARWLKRGDKKPFVQEFSPHVSLPSIRRPVAFLNASINKAEVNVAFQKRIARFWPANITETLHQNLDVLLAGICLSPYEAALYLIARRLMNCVNLLLDALRHVAGPKLASAMSSPEKLQFIARSVGQMFVFLGALAWIGLLVMAPIVLVVFFSDYQEAYSILIWRSLAVLGIILTGPSGVTMMMTGLERARAVVLLLSLAGGAGFMFWSAMTYGVIGLAVAHMVMVWSIQLICGLLVWYYRGVGFSVMMLICPLQSCPLPFARRVIKPVPAHAGVFADEAVLSRASY